MSNNAFKERPFTLNGIDTSLGNDFVSLRFIKYPRGFWMSSCFCFSSTTRGLESVLLSDGTWTTLAEGLPLSWAPSVSALSKQTLRRFFAADLPGGPTLALVGD